MQQHWSVDPGRLVLRALMLEELAQQKGLPSQTLGPCVSRKKVV